MRRTPVIALLNILGALLLLVIARPHAQAPRIPGFVLPGNEIEGFRATADLDGDGEEELILSTVDQENYHGVSPATAVHVLGVVNDQVVDRTLDFFDEPPMTFYTRTILTADFNGDGQLDVYFCTGGRETTDRTPLQTLPRTQGIWGEQDLVYFGNNGRLVDRTSTLPQSIDYSHGCSYGDIYKVGRPAVVINDVAGPFPPYTASSAALQWNGTQFEVKYPFPVFTGTRTGKPFGFYTVTADYDKNGYADVIGDSDILWGGPAGPASKSIPPNALETPTFGTMQGRAVADFNGDGYPDGVKIVSTTPATGLKGARFVLYLGGPNGVTEKRDAFPALEAYDAADFGLDVTVIDINFDGLPDIATLGEGYNIGAVNNQGSAPTAVWLNDGTGRFTFARYSTSLTAQSVCQNPFGKFLDVYFLQTSDPQRYKMIAGGCYPGTSKTVFTARTVTPSAPLTFSR